MKNILFYNLLELMRLKKDKIEVLEGLNRLIILGEITPEEKIPEKYQESYYINNKLKLTENLEELLYYYNQLEESFDIITFSRKYYMKNFQKEELVSAFLSNMGLIITKPEDMQLKLFEDMLENIKNLEEFFDIPPKEYKSINEIDSIFYKTLKEINDNNLYSGEEKEEKINKYKITNKEIEKKFFIIENQEKILKIILTNPIFLKLFIEKTSLNFFTDNLKKISTFESINININLKIKKIIPDLNLIKNNEGVELYKLFIKNNINISNDYLKNLDELSNENKEYIEKKIIKYIYSSYYYTGENVQDIANVLLSINDWFTYKKSDYNEDIITFFIDKISANSESIELLINNIKNNEKFQEFLINRDINIIGEILFNNEFKITYYNNLSKIIPELEYKYIGEEYLKRLLADNNKTMALKYSKLLEKIKPSFLINNKEMIISFFMNEYFNNNNNYNEFQMKNISMIKNIINNYNKEEKIIDEDLLKNLNNWNEICNKYVINYYSEHLNMNKEDIYKLLKESNLPIDILKESNTVRLIKKTYPSILDSSLEKIAIENNVKKVDIINNNKRRI